MKTAQPVPMKLARPSVNADKTPSLTHATPHKTPEKLGSSTRSPSGKPAAASPPKPTISSRLGSSSNLVRQISSSPEAKLGSSTNGTSLPKVLQTASVKRPVSTVSEPTSTAADEHHDESHEDHPNESSMSHVSTVADEVTHQLTVQGELITRQAKLIHDDAQHLKVHEAALAEQTTINENNTRQITTHNTLLEEMMQEISTLKEAMRLVTSAGPDNHHDIQAAKGTTEEQGVQRMDANEATIAEQQTQIAELNKQLESMHNGIAQLQEAMVLLNESVQVLGAGLSQPAATASPSITRIVVTAIGTSLATVAVIAGVSYFAKSEAFASLYNRFLAPSPSPTSVTAAVASPPAPTTTVAPPVSTPPHTNHVNSTLKKKVQ